MFSQGDEKYSFENPNPFLQTDEEVEVASVAYRYVILKYNLCFYYINIYRESNLYLLVALQSCN